jgi:hypothetical protein
MISWLFSKKPAFYLQTSCPYSMLGDLFSNKGNTLILIGDDSSFSKFYNTYIKISNQTDVIFQKNETKISDDGYEKKNKIWDEIELDNIILRQKVIKDEDLIEPPFVVVFNNCLDNIYSQGVIECIKDAKELNTRSLIIVKNCKSIPDKLWCEFDTILVVGKKKNKNHIQLKYIWDKTRKNKMEWSEFKEKVKPRYKQSIIIKDNYIQALPPPN